MKKYEMIKKSTDFDDIIKTGLVLKSKYFYIYYKDGNKEFPMFGLAVSKKLGNAVVRNKIKRQLRVIIDANKKRFKKYQNYIIIVKKSVLEKDFQKMKLDFEELLERGI